jgi:hypothetical protein
VPSVESGEKKAMIARTGANAGTEETEAIKVTEEIEETEETGVIEEIEGIAKNEETEEIVRIEETVGIEKTEGTELGEIVKTVMIVQSVAREANVDVAKTRTKNE